MFFRLVSSLAAIVVFCFVSSDLYAAGLCTDPVETVSGMVQGMDDEQTATCSWKGVPYAAPPVGELRWASPKPHPKWEGTKETTEFGDRCMQKGILELLNSDPKSMMSEDCLYLNIYRPKKSGQFPVMVWIHGGGYTGGTGKSYRGDMLAESGDIVVVTINYRLAVFGFFPHPDLKNAGPDSAAGGQGSLDQVMALKWVHENIENFGGDPENVTIFGESAGGWSVCTMVATPLAKGYFQKAILQSGGCKISRDQNEGFEYTMEIAKKMGCKSGDIECLRALPAKKVNSKSPQGAMGTDYIPHHDGHLLVSAPLDMIRGGNYNKVLFMAGSNRDEFGMMAKFKPKLRHTRPKKYEKRLEEIYNLSPEQASELASHYPLTDFDQKPVNAFVRMSAESSLGCPTYLGLVAASEKEPPAYLYRFDYDDQKYGKYMGSFHALEIPFVFGSLEDIFGLKLINEKNIDSAQEMSRIVQSYWVNFAKTGNPNGPDLPEWPEFEKESSMIMILDNNTRAEKTNMYEKCSLWEEASKR
jgi:para-nitrobenzyl esterase